MRSYHWTEDTFGSLLPDDWERIADVANEIIRDYNLANGEGSAEDYFHDFVELDSFCDDCHSLFSREAQASWKLDAIGYCPDSSLESVSGCYERIYGAPFPCDDAEFASYKAAGQVRFDGIIASFWIEL